MLCHRKSRGVVAYASQMLTNATTETSPSFADVEMGASTAGETVHKIFRSAGEMIADGEGAFRAPYIGTRGTLSTVVSPRSDPVRASGRPMVVTLRRFCSSEVSG